MVTMDAAQGVKAKSSTITSRIVVPIHYNDCVGFKSPLDDLKRAVTEANLEDRI